jgi:predicted HTH transcriptional regulator
MGEKRGEDLSENRQDILEAIRENPQVTHAQLIKIVGINSTNFTKGEFSSMKNIEILSKVNETDMGAILEVWESSVRA